MTMDIVRSLAQLQALKEEWDALAAPMGSPLLEHDWIVSCAETLHTESSLRVAVVRSGGTLRAAAPLALETAGSGPRLTLVGASALYEPGGWLFTSPSSLDDLLSTTFRVGKPVVLHRVPADGDLSEALPSLARRRALTLVRPTASSLAVSTRGGWDEYYSTLSSRITTNLPRLRRKAERELGEMRIDQQSPVPGAVDSLLEKLIAVEGSGWKGRRGSSLGRRSDLQRFFRAYCRRAAERGTLRITTLTFGSSIAAMELAVESHDRLWQLKTGYQESLAAYYPGLQLTRASIRSAFDRGLDSYEFLGSAESWEERWRPQVRNYHLMLLYPLNVGGMLGACRDLADVFWRRTNSAMKFGAVRAGMRAYSRASAMLVRTTAADNR